MQAKKSWLRANEARRMLRGSSCDLMHFREAGKLRIQKQGNAFLYASADVARDAAHFDDRLIRHSPTQVKQ